MQGSEEHDLARRTSPWRRPSRALGGFRHRWLLSNGLGGGRLLGWDHGRGVSRRVRRAVALVLLLQLALAISAVACEGLGGPPPPPPPPQQPPVTQKCGQTVNCATGDETTQQTDTAIGGRGLGLNIVRSYDAQVSATAQEEGKGVGLWGWGWTGPYGTRLVLGTSEVGQET